MGWTSLDTITGVGDTNGATTDPMDTIGAKLLVVFVTYFTDANFTDSKGNMWTPSTTAVGGAPKSRFYYSINPITSAAHTFTFDGTAGIFAGIIAQAFTTPGKVLFDDNSAFGNGIGVTQIQPGSLTPSDNGALLVCGVGSGSSGIHTIDLSFNKTEEIPFAVGVNIGAALAWLEQTTAAAINPEWTSTTSGQHTANMVAFTVDAGIKQSVIGSRTRSRRILGLMR